MISLKKILILNLAIIALSEPSYSSPENNGHFKSMDYLSKIQDCFTSLRNTYDSWQPFHIGWKPQPERPVKNLGQFYNPEEPSSFFLQPKVEGALEKE